jgi:hypothetical protein
MSITLTATSVTVTPSSYNRVDVELEMDDESEVLDEIGIRTAIAHYGDDDLLDEIGVEYVKQYFNLIEKSEDDGE